MTDVTPGEPSGLASPAIEAPSELAARQGQASVPVLCCGKEAPWEEPGRRRYVGCEPYEGHLQDCLDRPDKEVFVECGGAQCDPDGCTCDGHRPTSPSPEAAEAPSG